jgi:hypothetical protein
VCKEPSDIMSGMTRDQVKEILDRVLSWPADDQEKFVRFVSELEQWREADEIADLGRART